MPKELLDKVISSEILTSFFKANNNSVIIEALSYNEEFEKVLKINDALKSIIASPLFIENNRIGTLVIGKTEDFGFEFDDLNIIGAFSSNLSIALENSKLIKKSIDAEQYKRELTLAQEMMKKLLPQKLPKVENYDFAALTLPAEVVGGDYYDYVYLKNNKLCFIIGDVSGKGISAAFFMAQVKGITLALAKESESASDLLIKINSALKSKVDKHLYITMTAIVIEDEIGNLSIARAGHLPTLIYTDNTIIELLGKGMGIGLANSTIFDNNIEEINYQLKENDYCIIYTDGVTESRDTSNNELGIDNLKNCILNNKYKSALEMVEEIKNCSIIHSDNQKQHDDISVLAISFIK